MTRDTTTTTTLNPAIAAATVGGWYRPKTARQAGEVFRLSGMPVAVLAARTELEPVGAPDDVDADGEHAVCWLRLRDATEAEMRVAEASRAAFRAGAGADHPARRANAEQMRRISGESS